MAAPAGQVHADIFAHGRPSDSSLRDTLAQDRERYYLQTAGIDHQENEERISEVRSLASGAFPRPRGLRDMDKALEAYLREQLQKDRDYKNWVSLTHPLLLLEYSSPVLADVVKHYRMTAYERLGIEQARLEAIERATEGRGDRLARQSQRDCLRRNESRGLVAAMRICQDMARPLENLTGIDGSTLQDGRHRIHVVREALQRLGFDGPRIEKIITMTGDKVISDDGYEDQLPDSGFEQKVSYARQKLVRQWRDALAKFRETGRTSPAGLEELSLPGAPATVQVLADLSLLEAHEQDIAVFKLASWQAFIQTERMYRQAARYLDLCRKDPMLSEEFRNIVGEKSGLLREVLAGAEKDREGAGTYKDLFSFIARSADTARERMRRRMPAAPSSPFPAEFMLNF